MNETPIIVMGNQKSSTSAIAHLLADYGALSKTADIPPPRGYCGLDVMRGHSSFAQIVDEYPYFFRRTCLRSP